MADYDRVKKGSKPVPLNEEESDSEDNSEYRGPVAVAGTPEAQVEANANYYHNYLLEKEQRVSEEKAKLEKQGIDLHYFEDTTIYDVMIAVKNNSPVEGVDLTAELMSGKARFMTHDDPEFSLEFSNALAAFAKNITSLQKHKASTKGVEKRNKNADQFAVDMREIIQNLKQSSDDSLSYRQTAELLNKNKVPTYRNGSVWHASMISNLHDRWKKLGLTVQKPDQP